jgi:hypothetical protein
MAASWLFRQAFRETGTDLDYLTVTISKAEWSRHIAAIEAEAVDTALAAEKAAREADWKQVAAEKALIFDDLAAILRALGLFDGARPISGHDVVQTVILPALAAEKERVARLLNVAHEADAVVPWLEASESYALRAALDKVRALLAETTDTAPAEPRDPDDDRWLTDNALQPEPPAEPRWPSGEGDPPDYLRESVSTREQRRIVRNWLASPEAERRLAAQLARFGISYGAPGVAGSILQALQRHTDTGDAGDAGLISTQKEGWALAQRLADAPPIGEPVIEDDDSDLAEPPSPDIWKGLPATRDTGDAG